MEQVFESSNPILGLDRSIVPSAHPPGWNEQRQTENADQQQARKDRGPYNSGSEVVASDGISSVSMSASYSCFEGTELHP